MEEFVTEKTKKKIHREKILNFSTIEKSKCKFFSEEDKREKKQHSISYSFRGEFLKIYKFQTITCIKTLKKGIGTKKI